jgi:hypothetical protein
MTDSRSEKIRKLIEQHPVGEAEAEEIRPLLPPPPRVLLAARHPCPYCTSQFTVAAHDGQLDVRHQGPFGSRCEAGLRQLLGEEAGDDGLALVISHG